MYRRNLAKPLEIVAVECEYSVHAGFKHQGYEPRIMNLPPQYLVLCHEVTPPFVDAGWFSQEQKAARSSKRIDHAASKQNIESIAASLDRSSRNSPGFNQVLRPDIKRLASQDQRRD
jgi:hypothetical protein